MLSARFPRLRTTPAVIPCGVDIDEVAMAGTVDPGGRPTVLGVGRLEPYKRMSRLVGAMAFLPAGTRAVLIGDGSERESILRMAQEGGLDDRFRSYTSVPRDELLSWYRSADVFVSMSAHESFGIAILEAAVTGTRVVASDIPAHREVAGFLPAGAVTLVDPAISDEGLARAITDAATRGKVRDAAANVPTWQDAARRTRAIYETFSAGRSRILPASRWLARPQGVRRHRKS